MRTTKTPLPGTWLLTNGKKRTRPDLAFEPCCAGTSTAASGPARESGSLGGRNHGLAAPFAPPHIDSTDYTADDREGYRCPQDRLVIFAEEPGALLAGNGAQV